MCVAPSSLFPFQLLTSLFCSLLPGTEGRCQLLLYVQLGTPGKLCPSLVSRRAVSQAQTPGRLNGGFN